MGGCSTGGRCGVVMKGWLRYWRVILALVTVFLAGGLMGFTAGTEAAKRKVQQLNMPENWSGLMMRKLDHDLGLTEEQRQQVAPLLRTAARDLFNTRRQAAVSSMQHVRTFYTALEPILTPEQKRKLEVAKERMKQRYKEGFENRSFGPGGPGRPPFPMPPRPPGKGGGQFGKQQMEEPAHP